MCLWRFDFDVFDLERFVGAPANGSLAFDDLSSGVRHYIQQRAQIAMVICLEGGGGEGKGVGKELDRGLRTLLPSPPMFTTLPFFSSFAELVVLGVLCVLLHP